MLFEIESLKNIVHEIKPFSYAEMVEVWKSYIFFQNWS